MRLILAAFLAILSLTSLPLHAETPAATVTPAAEKPVTPPPAATHTTPAEIQPGSDPKGAPTSAAPPTPTADGGAPPSENRVARMRDRWRKMTPEQREEMKTKAARRLQERYERLSPQEQTQVTGIMDQIGKLSREQRSILLARVHQKAAQERTQRRLIKEQEAKPDAMPAATPASAPAPAAPPAEPAKP
jgi:hypothetical protein